MKILCDTHVHTETSLHATGTVEEVARRAAEIGFECIAITDHCSLKMVHFERSLEVLSEQIIPHDMYGVRLMRGVEIDIHDYKGHLCFYNVPYDGEQSALDRFLSTREVVVASPHFLPEDREGSYEEVTEMFLSVASNPYVTTVGHPERIGMPYDRAALAVAGARSGTFIELNNTSLLRGYRDAVREQLICCRDVGAMIVVNSDAHECALIGDFTEAYSLLREVDFPPELIANRTLRTFEESLCAQRAAKGRI